MFGEIDRSRYRWPVSALLAVGAIGFALGTWNGHGREAAAQPPAGPVVPASGRSDNSQRVIAYIYGNIPITREEFGEFLIDRQGQNNMDLLVTRKITDHTSNQHNTSA